MATKAPVYFAPQDSRRKKALRLALLFLLWLPATSYVAYLLIRVDVPVAHGVQLGRITEINGTVHQGSKSSLLWHRADLGEGLSSGDKIATVGPASATISLGDGRQLNIGPNSMVSIEAGTDTGTSQARGITLVLYKGDLAAVNNQAPRGAKNESDRFNNALAKFGIKSAPATPVPIIIKSGAGKFLLDGSDNEGLFLHKTAAATSPDVRMVSGTVQSSSSGGTSLPLAVTPAAASLGLLDEAPGRNFWSKELHSAAQSEQKLAQLKRRDQLKVPPPALPPLSFKVAPVVSAAVAPSRPPAVLLPPKPAILAASTRAEVEKESAPVAPDLTELPQLAAAQARIFFTGASLATGCQAASVPITVDPPPGTPVLSRWVPFIDIEPAGRSAETIRVYGVPGFHQQTLLLPTQKICHAAIGTRAGPGLKLTVRTGASFAVGEPETLSRQTYQLFLGSLADFPDEPVTLHLTGLNAKNITPGNWVPLAAQTPSGNNVFVIKLASGRLLPRLWPLIAASSSFTLGGEFGNPPTQAHYITGGVNIGDLGGAAFARPQALSVARLLGAEIAYIGAVDAYKRLPSAKVTRVDIVHLYLNKHKSARVLVRRRLVTIDRSDWHEGGSLHAITDNALDLFTPEADILLPE